MSRKERIELVRRLLWTNRDMPLTEVAKLSGVSLRTTYRDLHAVLSRTVTIERPVMLVRQ